MNKLTKDEWIGRRFGRLVVINLVKSTTETRQKALCKCDCGNFKTVMISNLKNGATQSCGCWHRESTSKANATHHATGTKLHNEWRAMKARCNIKSCSNYESYGGRGISVCKEWNDSFEIFKEWSENNGYQEDLTLDRIDVNGNYEPNNCRWVDKKVQARNRRPRSTCKTGVSGVAKRSDRDSYRVSIGVNGKCINIGNFRKFEDAVQARKEAELKYWGFTLIK